MQKKQLALRRSRNGQPRTTPVWTVERIKRCLDSHGVSHQNHSNHPLRNQPKASSSTGVSLEQSLWTNALGSTVIDMVGSACCVSLTLYSRKCKFLHSNPSGRIVGVNKLTTWASVNLQISAVIPNLIVINCSLKQNPLFWIIYSIDFIRRPTPFPLNIIPEDIHCLNDTSLGVWIGSDFQHYFFLKLKF